MERESFDLIAVCVLVSGVHNIRNVEGIGIKRQITLLILNLDLTYKRMNFSYCCYLDNELFPVPIFALIMSQFTDNNGDT